MVTLAPPTNKAWNDWSSYFGETAGRSNPHTGIDWGWGSGYDVYAPFDGVITAVNYEAGYNGGQGGIMDITNGRVRVRFMHLNSNSDLGYRVGDRVSRGERVTVMGVPTTGSSTGTHLHMSMWIDGQLVNPAPYFTQDLPIDAGAPVAGPGVYRDGGWDGISTLYKGTYGEQNDGDYYIIRVGETIWDAVTARGLSLDQVRAWTAAIAESKWAGTILGANPGSSFWTGGDHYYAGCTIALRDVVAKYAAEEAAAAAATAAAEKQIAEIEAARGGAAAEQLRMESVAAAEDVATATAEKASTKALAEKIATAADIKAQAELKAAEAALAAQAAAEAAVALERAQAAAAARAAELEAALEHAKSVVLPQVAANAEIALYGSSESADSKAPLAGLFADDPSKRKKWYLRYAVAALIVSFVPDIVTVLTVVALATGIPMDTTILLVTAAASLTSSILLKIGTAFGFVAASNTSTPAAVTATTKKKD